eukprot:TRINITY_DN967_c0_g1_i1.p1 TRINITY_DN967_c0_g1~~TRINITY_DN967_c0_g1_i1.p1  ORF type:complete len:696 (+),score=171.12 TRINITY_DN967_c0_g1_i1:44-2089(+)
MGKGRNHGETPEHEGVSTADYMISLMGYAVGIGNVWRFPYLVGRHGGCAFIVAYVICLVFLASPMYLLELIWGNTTRKNTIGTFKTMHPCMVGVAYTSAVMLFFILPYYNLLLSYSMVYLVNSFKDPLPWTYEALPPNVRHDQAPSEHFWYNEVLVRFPYEDVKNGDFSGLGTPQWHIIIGNLAVYIIVYLALFRGMEASAKVTYVTVGLPIILMVILFFKSITLEGAGDGIEFYILRFEWSALGDLAVWKDAASQILFSLSPGMGTAITLSSYTRPKEDVYKVNTYVTLCNSSFSIFSGFSVFSILGFMAQKRCNTPGLSCQTVAELAKNSGTGLAFMTLAEGVSLFGSGSGVFSFFLFVMLLTLGLDSTFAWTETLNTYAYDYLKSKDSPYARKEVVTGVFCVVFFLIGIIYSTRLGIYILDVVDNWAATYTTIVVCFAEWFMLLKYWGWDRLEEGLARATRGSPGFPEGRSLGPFWKGTILWTSGPMLATLFVVRIYYDTSERYGEYPNGIIAIGWMVYAICMLPIPVFMAWNWNKEPEPLFLDKPLDAEEPLLSDTAPAGGAKDTTYRPPEVGSQAITQPHISHFVNDGAKTNPHAGGHTGHTHVHGVHGANDSSNLNGLMMKGDETPPPVPAFPPQGLDPLGGHKNSVSVQNACPLLAASQTRESAGHAHGTTTLY